jgi:hypothetical protein
MAYRVHVVTVRNRPTKLYREQTTSLLFEDVLKDVMWDPVLPVGTENVAFR